MEAREAAYDLAHDLSHAPRADPVSESRHPIMAHDVRTVFGREVVAYLERIGRVEGFAVVFGRDQIARTKTRLILGTFESGKDRFVFRSNRGYTIGPVFHRVEIAWVITAMVARYYREVGPTRIRRCPQAYRPGRRRG